MSHAISPLLLVGAIFIVVLLLLWLVLYFGSRWLSRRQQRLASAAQSDLAGMFIFTDAERIFVLNLVLAAVAPIGVWLLTGNLLLAGLAAALALAAPQLLLRIVGRRRLRRAPRRPWTTGSRDDGVRPRACPADPGPIPR